MATSFVEELKRRNVFRVAIIYFVVSWLLMQVGDVMFPALLFPDWTSRMLIAFLILGMPIALIFAWAYDWYWHVNNRNLDSIREEPEFQEIVAELEAAMAAQLKAINELPDMGKLDLRFKELN